jgi:hypothetical protein
MADRESGDAYQTWMGEVTTGTVSQHSIEIEIGQIKRVTLVGVGNI